MIDVRRLHSIVISILLAALILAALMFFVVSAGPAAPSPRVTFSKEVSDAAPQVGETFTVTLHFNTTEAETQTIRVRVVDPNPYPNFLTVMSDTITGGATYSPTIDGVVWQGTLFPAGTSPYEVAFQVQVTGIPTPALANGFLVINTATMNDVADPATLPEQNAVATFRIMPWRVFLPSIARNADG